MARGLFVLGTLETRPQGWQEGARESGGATRSGLVGGAQSPGACGRVGPKPEPLGAPQTLGRRFGGEAGRLVLGGGLRWSEQADHRCWGAWQARSRGDGVSGGQSGDRVQEVEDRSPGGGETF